MRVFIIEKREHFCMQTKTDKNTYTALFSLYFSTVEPRSTSVLLCEKFASRAAIPKQTLSHRKSKNL